MNEQPNPQGVPTPPASSDAAVQQPTPTPEFVADPPPPQIPTPEPAVTPPASGPRRGLAIAALILGIAALVFVWAPVFGVIVAIVGLIIGIIALVKKQPKAFALTGTILSAIALITSLIITVFIGLFTAAVISSVDESTQISVEEPGTSTENHVPESDAPGGSTDESSGSEESAVGTRENPVPLGSKITGSDWEVVINTVNLSATEAVMQASEFNTEPPSGQQYALVNLTTKYLGEDSGMPIMVSVDYVTGSGEVISTWDSIAIAPEPTIGMSELLTGGTATGNQVFLIPAAADGVLRVRPGMLADEVFVAAK